MRRYMWKLVGVVELAIAGCLLLLNSQLPSSNDVGRHIDQVKKISVSAERKVDALRGQVADFRGPKLHDTTQRMSQHTLTLSQLLQRQSLDFQAIATLQQSLDAVIAGLDAWSNSLDAERMQQLSQSLRTTADFFDGQIVPESQKAAQGLEEAIALMQDDARRFAELLRQAPPSFKSLEAIHDTLASVDQAATRISNALPAERLDQIRDGFQGMETALTTTADQVDRLTNYSYPVMKFDSLRSPRVEMKPFWPEGEKIAAGLRQATRGVQAANKEMDMLRKELPAIRETIRQNQKGLSGIREALSEALKAKPTAERLLSVLPDHAAKLADRLPVAGGSLAKALRQTQRLTEVAAALRKAADTLDRTLATWPQVQTSLKKSSDLLRLTRTQLDRVILDRPLYEKALQQSSELAQSFAQLMPVFSDQIDTRLAEQEYALKSMKEGLSEFHASLPTLEQNTNHLLGTIRWLFALVALLIAGHGIWMLGHRS